MDNIKLNTATAMSNNKQTSIEWLQWALEHTILTHEQIMQTIGLFEQAKLMHKEEVTKFTEDWYHHGSVPGLGVLVLTRVNEHYNETFGGNNEQQ